MMVGGGFGFGFGKYRSRSVALSFQLTHTLLSEPDSLRLGGIHWWRGWFAGL
jgi:hypothetical protein